MMRADTDKFKMIAGRFTRFAATAVLLLSGCAKNEPATVGSETNLGTDEISFTTYTGRAVTKAGTSLTQSFNVEAFLTSSKEKHFDATDYRYSGSEFIGETSHFWPLVGNLDFYAVSPLKYRNTSSSDITLSVSDSSFIVTGTDGKTDILAARKVNQSRGEPVQPVSMEFGHKLTKIAFNAVGADSSKIYKIDSIVVTANSTAKYSFGSASGWGTSSDAYDYVFLGTDKTIPSKTKSAIPVGDTLYLIPTQTSVKAKVRYSIYEGAFKIDSTFTPIEVILPITAWGINKSIVYSLTLNYTSSTDPIIFNSTETDWESDVKINIFEDLSREGSANCYIVSEAGTYLFKAVKGNSSEPVGTVAGATVLWETFGNATTPAVGAIIKPGVSFSDGYITFSTNNAFTEGNAVIAAKDASDNILWSWHIWCTDRPELQVYNNDAGIMMDRNLGAISAAKGDVGALGLLYQWGRKDPFLSGRVLREEPWTNQHQAASTISWPAAEEASSHLSGDNNTLAYSISHPTTFIKYGVDHSHYDWYSVAYSYRNDTLWRNTSVPHKTIYDPCPPGYRVPDGGSDGIWEKAGFEDHHPVDSVNIGIDFAEYTSSDVCWYPGPGQLVDTTTVAGVKLCWVGTDGFLWSCTPFSSSSSSYYYYNCRSYSFWYNGYRKVYPHQLDYRYLAKSVRCLLE